MLLTAVGLASTGKIFATVWQYMGVGSFCLALHDDLPLAEALFENVARLQLESMLRVIKYGRVGGLWMADDLAHSTGLHVPPPHFRQYLIPWYEKIGNASKAKDILYLLHSGCRLWQVQDGIAAAGFNAIRPIEPKAMDIVEVKRVVGMQMCMIGGMVSRRLYTRTDSGGALGKFAIVLLRLPPRGATACRPGIRFLSTFQWKTTLPRSRPVLRWANTQLRCDSHPDESAVHFRLTEANSSSIVSKATTLTLGEALNIPPR